MAIGKRKSKQDELFIPTAKLANGPGHPFYSKLNQVLADAGFDEFVERLCAPYYKEGGRPGIPPGVYFRMLLIGYFESLDIIKPFLSSSFISMPTIPGLDKKPE
jgi:transposase